MPAGRPRTVALTDLGRRLDAYSAARGYGSLRAAALAAGLNYELVRRWATGGTDPQTESLDRFVTGIGGSLAEFYSIKVD